MSIGNRIQQQRKQMGITQEGLAQMLGVTNQAVSKWETDQSVPDTMLLPALADVLGVSIDALFGREPASPAVPETETTLPWQDDDAFHVVVYCGHTLIGENPMKEKTTFCYEGPVRDLYCDLNVECDEVGRDVYAGGYVQSESVHGNLSAGGYVECEDAYGSVFAGGYVECEDVYGSVQAGGYAECEDVGGNVTAGTYVECGDVVGSVTENHVDGNAQFVFRGENVELTQLGDRVKDMVKDVLKPLGLWEEDEE